jgi:hypothetical protein
MAVAAVVTSAAVVVPAVPAAADLPVPVPLPGSGIVRQIVNGASGWAWDQVANGIAGWVLGAAGTFVNGVVNFLKTEARPDPSAPWFSGPGSPYAAVRGIAATLLVGFLFLGLVSGLAHGDVAGMVRRMAADLPLAVIGTTVTITIVGYLLQLTDALSTDVLTNTGGQATKFLAGFGAVASGATGGFAAVLAGLVAVMAGFFLWVELMVRSVLVYLLVAISPLGFAALLWPAARVVLRRLAELLVAVIFSKFVISLALAVGVAALAGASDGKGSAGVGTQAAGAIGTLLTGCAVLALAAFSPFLVLKLIPAAEAAVAAHGVSRGPVRAGHAGMTNLYHAQAISRLVGGSRSGRAGASSERVDGISEAAAASRAAGMAAAGPSTGAGTAGAAGAEGAAGAGGAAAAGATGPVGAAAAAKAAVDAARERGRASVGQASDLGAGPTDPAVSGQSRPDAGPPAGKANPRHHRQPPAGVDDPSKGSGSE